MKSKYKFYLQRNNFMLLFLSYKFAEKIHNLCKISIKQFRYSNLDYTNYVLSFIKFK